MDKADKDNNTVTSFLSISQKYKLTQRHILVHHFGKLVLNKDKKSITTAI
jgi:hypothetical protein